MRKRLEVLTLVLIFLSVFTIYLKTLAPTLYLEDSGEFIASAYVLGINHPPGYPLLTLGNKIICQLTLGAISFRVNLLAAILAVCGLLLFYRLVRELGSSNPVGMAGTILLGVSQLWWSQAIQPEVYLLNGIFAILILLFFVRAPHNRHQTAFYWGLGFANHYLILTFIPLVLFGWLRKKERLAKSILNGLLLLMLGMMLYLYLPLRGQAVPGLSWHKSPATFSGAVTMLSRRQFKGIEFSNKVTWEDKSRFLLDFVRKLANQGTFILLILAGIGTFWLFKQNSALFGWLVYLFLANSVAIILILRFPFDPLKVFTVTPYYLVSYIVLLVLAILGLQRLALKRRSVVIGLSLVLFIWLIYANGKKVNARSFYIAYDYGQNLINNTRGKGVIMVAGIYQFFPLMYNKLVENRLPNLIILESNPSAFSRYRDLIAKNPLYLVQLPMNTKSDQFATEGLIFRQRKTTSEITIRQWDKYLVMRGLMVGNSGDFSHPEETIRRYYSRFYLQQAMTFSKERRTQGVKRAISLVNKINPSIDLPPGIFN